MKSSVRRCHQQAIINNEAEEPVCQEGLCRWTLCYLSYKDKSIGKKI